MVKPGVLTRGGDNAKADADDDGDKDGGKAQGGADPELLPDQGGDLDAAVDQ